MLSIVKEQPRHNTIQLQFSKSKDFNLWLKSQATHRKTRLYVWLHVKNQITSRPTLDKSDFTRHFGQLKIQSSFRFQSGQVSETFIFLDINKMHLIFEGAQY